jgi:mannose-6-phosphate isomerase-like protein (cupin superfamily)
MTLKIEKPTEIKAHGNKPKIIQEFIGCVNSHTEDISIAKMNSPEGWIEPGQTPEFDEYTVVLNGTLCVKTKEEKFEITAGQAVITSKGEWVQYSTPYAGGAEYIAVCLPAFSPQLVHRDED